MRAWECAARRPSPDARSATSNRIWPLDVTCLVITLFSCSGLGCGGPLPTAAPSPEHPTQHQTGHSDTKHAWPRLALGVDGSGSIAVPAIPFVCGHDCVLQFREPRDASLLAVARHGSVFVRWTGDCSSSDATCVVDLEQDLQVGAVFAQLPGSEGGSSSRP